MVKRKLFLYLAAASGYVGIGMLLGYSLSDKATNTALWLGIVLVILCSILIGMYISAREPLRGDNSTTANDTTPPDNKSQLE